MPKTPPSLVVSLVVLAAACSKPGPPSETIERTPSRASETPTQQPPQSPETPPKSERPATETHDEEERGRNAAPGVRAPMTVTVSGPPNPKSGQEIDINVVIDRARPSTTPITLRIKVPAGAQLARGDRKEVITDSSATEIRRTFRVTLRRVPSTDLTVSVDSRGPSSGVHATGSYRFGRPAEKLPQPKRSSTPTVIGGRNLGRPIMILPPASSSP